MRVPGIGEGGACWLQLPCASDYDPDGQFESLAAGEQVTDTFAYTVSDGQGGEDTATVTVVIAGLDDGPWVYEVFLPVVVKDW